MRRTILSLAAALAMTLAGALPVTAVGESVVRLDCDDGTSVELEVDADTLISLTESVQAMLEFPAGLTCSLTQLPGPLVRFGSVANAAKVKSGYVIGGGQVLVVGGCPDGGNFVGSFGVNMYKTADGGVRGSGKMKIPDGQCVGPATLSSTATCLAIFPVTGVVGGRAWANSHVTDVRGTYWAPQQDTEIGWGFQDNGPKGSPTPDRFQVEERPSSCPLFGDPNQTFFDLISGGLTIRP